MEHGGIVGESTWVVTILGEGAGAIWCDAVSSKKKKKFGVMQSTTVHLLDNGA